MGCVRLHCRDDGTRHAQHLSRPDTTVGTRVASGTLVDSLLSAPVLGGLVGEDYHETIKDNEHEVIRHGSGLGGEWMED